MVGDRHDAEELTQETVPLGAGPYSSTGRVAFEGYAEGNDAQTGAAALRWYQEESYETHSEVQTRIAAGICFPSSSPRNVR